MPIDLSRVPERLTNAVATGTLIPFVGAGISRSAITSDPDAFPTWSKLLKELSKQADDMQRITPDERVELDSLVDKGKHLMAAQHLRSTLPKDVVYSIFRRRFMPRGAKPGPIHRSIFKLNSPFIITTNYDMLLEDGYAAV